MGCPGKGGIHFGNSLGGSKHPRKGDLVQFASPAEANAWAKLGDLHGVRGVFRRGPPEKGGELGSAGSGDLAGWGIWWGGLVGAWSGLGRGLVGLCWGFGGGLVGFVWATAWFYVSSGPHNRVEVMALFGGMVGEGNGMDGIDEDGWDRWGWIWMGMDGIGLGGGGAWFPSNPIELFSSIFVWENKRNASYTCSIKFKCVQLSTLEQPQDSVVEINSHSVLTCTKGPRNATHSYLDEPISTTDDVRGACSFLLNEPKHCSCITYTVFSCGAMWD